MEHPVPEEVGLLMGVEEVQEPVAAHGRGRWYLPLTLLGAVAAIAVVTFSASAHKPIIGSTSERQVLSLFGSTYAASMSCYSYTGGTCGIQACEASRGASCENKKCVCEAACAGADGKCHTGETNMLVATGITLTNKYWPKYSMYFKSISATGQLKTTKAYSAFNMGTDKFSLYKLPGPSNETSFMLGSVSDPSKVARIGLTTGTSVVASHGLYSTGLSDGKGPEVLAVSACHNAAKQALMFGNKAGSYWAYLHTGSWLVYASSAERCTGVGDGGLWTPSPALDAEQIAMLPKCC